MLIDSCEGTSCCEVLLYLWFLKGCFATPLPEKFCSLLIGFFRGQNIGFFRNIFLFCCPGASPSIYRIYQGSKMKYLIKIFWEFSNCDFFAEDARSSDWEAWGLASSQPPYIGFFGGHFTTILWKIIKKTHFNTDVLGCILGHALLNYHRYISPSTI